MSKHTPGPWDIYEKDVVANDGAVICTVKDLDDFPCIEDDNEEGGLEQLAEEFRANARLIAAAPELLEACEAMLPLVNNRLIGSGAVTSDPEFYKAVVRACEVMDAAIAKAKGDL